MIYISTGGVKNRTSVQFADELISNGIYDIELSGGKYSENILVELLSLSAKANFQIHNYFPPHEKPFVLNLGSLNPEVGEKSYKHILKALEWCSILGSDYYSFHAGFLLDPRVDELGRKITDRALYDRDKSKDLFISRVKNLYEVASKLDITLMIENNVLSKKNSLEFESNPLLMCTPDECNEVLNSLPENIKLLVDVAHLKVSANSLKFNPNKMFKMCEDRIGGYHLSDNNGLSDTNQAFNSESWFWSYLNPLIDYISIEVYSSDLNLLLDQKKLVQLKLKI
ncbi:MAG: TIM barrel protein [Nitrosomonadales bacterium]|jgi:sugar phosphate isomerase/epimerase|nr:TIM barrel protein [Nitrosomonadales bacterium]